MAFVFLGTVLFAAITMVGVIWIFPLETGLYFTEGQVFDVDSGNENWGESMVQFLTVIEFNQILSRQHMLAFIIFSFLIGLAALRSGEGGTAFRQFLNSGNEVMKVALIMVMKLAPVGLGAYFAYQVGTVGPQLFGIYAKPMGLYYGYGIVYFFLAFSLYAFLAYGRNGIRLMWPHTILRAGTASRTCSGIAVRPGTLAAARRMGAQERIATVAIPRAAKLRSGGSSPTTTATLAVGLPSIGRRLLEPMTL